MSVNNFNLTKFPKKYHDCIKFCVDVLISHVYPLLQRISYQLPKLPCEYSEEQIFNISNVYTLCADQIKKCFMSLLDIIKLEHKEQLYLQESRHCALERLTWCYQKLLSVEEFICSETINRMDSFDCSLLISPMYFVNWIDQTFDILGQLCNIVYRNNFKDTETELFNNWKLELVECVKTLHTSIDELLLSAMTLCRHCLLVDQHIVKARCQVVLRETKALLSDIINGELDTVPASPDTLRLPIKPSNVNVLIDVLKDVLYALETNTNTALLALVVHCFSYNVSPALMLKRHFEDKSGTCVCTDKGIAENCLFVKEFDLHNERLQQIGTFAISCSSDQKRVLSVRSALASLEALDPHLVPSVMLSPNSAHTSMLINVWNQEVNQIRDNVFLIVDPAAFSEKAQQMMHQKLLEITKENEFDIDKAHTVINFGSVVCDFFDVYEKIEPDALPFREQISPLLQDLNKVQMECKVVSNMLSSKKDTLYDVKMPKSENNKVTVNQAIKRLKLLYTLIKRINSIVNPKNDEDFYEDPIENRTHTLNFKNGETYVNSPKKNNNITRSIFARTNVRSSTGTFPLAILTKHLKTNKKKDLSFSLKLDEICNISDIKIKNREHSILYHTPLKNRSLRKAVLNRCAKDFANMQENVGNRAEESDNIVDETTTLQITGILNQINDLTINITETRQLFNSTANIEKIEDRTLKDNILTLTVNDTKFKKTWNISINESSVMSLTQPSEVNTLERISDLDLVESKLSCLKSNFETSL